MIPAGKWRSSTIAALVGLNFLGLLYIGEVIQLGKRFTYSRIQHQTRPLVLADLAAATTTIHDLTLDWRTDINRLWLLSKDDNTSYDNTTTASAGRPPAMLLLTNYGWNQPNQTMGLSLYRCVRSRELVQGVINHPWFHPIDWSKAMHILQDKSTRYYVFQDYQSCWEQNYPWYGWGKEKNADREFNRTEFTVTNNAPSVVALSQMIEGQMDHVKFITFDCRGDGIDTRGLRSNIVYAAISATYSQLRPGIDMGLVAPAVYQKDVLQTTEWCNNEINRTFFISFSGNFRSTTRQNLRLLHNDKDIFIANHPPPGETMGSALLKTIFALTPRGDNLFSYRFTEVMSTGAIPVVHADEWMLPFDKPLVDWSDIVVRIPEGNTNETVEILKAISPAKRCEMRRKGFEFYQKYMKDGDAVIRGIIDTLEGRVNNRSMARRL